MATGILGKKGNISPRVTSFSKEKKKKKKIEKVPTTTTAKKKKNEMLKASLGTKEDGVGEERG